MSFENPTQINPGMTGTFNGRTYRVVGRALLGEMEYGRIYYWNEYYLQAEGEEIVTLVYEETLLGGEWRLFVMFDPAHPLTAKEAATKREGDLVELDGVNARVTLVRESHVYNTEGRAPEGVKHGSRAHYFNAEAGQKLVVVSWTGHEVEFFHGTNLPINAVASAFNLHITQLVKFHVFGRAGNSAAVWKMLSVCLVAIALFFIISTSSQPSARPQPPPVARYDFPTAPLKAGYSGTLNGTNYLIEGQARVEIREVGRTIVHDEFFLQAKDGSDALLIYGWKPGVTNWLLFTALHPTNALTPQAAANLRQGRTVNLDGVVAQVDGLFLSTVLLSGDLNEPDSYTGNVRYGFSAHGADFYLLARWNERGIVFREGRVPQEGSVIGAFSPAVVK
jgi:hypothetical protein